MKSEDIIKIENFEKRDGFTIRWNLTYLCNYRCDFCIQGNLKSHIDKSKDESIEIRKKICNNLITLIEGKLGNEFDTIEIYLIGGEITILPDFLEIIEKIVNCKFRGKIIIRVTTNLSTKMEVLKKLMEIFNQKREAVREIRIKASYYKEFADEAKFMEKIKILNAKNKFSKFSKIKKIYKNFKRKFKRFKKIKIVNKIENKMQNVHVGVGYPLCNDNDYYEYLKFKKRNKKYIREIYFIVIKGYKTSISDKLKKKILKDNKQDKNIKVTFKNGETYYCSNNNKISLKLDGEERFNSRGYLCDIGINSISISNVGIVSRCTSCKSETIIGNMINGNVNIPKEKFLCPSNSCNCSYYGIIEKSDK